jgi:uncharacterized membrane protein YGL010W
MTLQEYLDSYEAAHRHPGNQITHAIGIPLIVVSLGLVFWHFWWAVGIFILGWIFQFLGHRFEGNSPKFFQGPMYLLVGPLWVVIKLARWLHLAK